MKALFGGGVEITSPWGRMRGFTGVLCAICLVPVALYRPEYERALLLFGAVCAAIYGVRHLLNNTTVRIEQKQLVIKTRPFPPPFDRKYLFSAIKGFEAVEVAYRGSEGKEYRTELELVLKSGKRISVQKNFKSDEHCERLCEKANNALRHQLKPHQDSTSS